MLIVQIIALYILKITVSEFSIKKYLANVIYPFILVVLFSFWIPIIIRKILELSFIKFIIVVVASVFTVAIESFFIAMKYEERNLLVSFVKSMFNFK